MGKQNATLRRWTAGLLSMAAGLWGCAEDASRMPLPAVGEETLITVGITVMQPGTRSALAPVAPEYELGITEAEHHISSLTLVMMNVTGDGAEAFEASQTIQAPTPTDDVCQVTFTFTGKAGTKRFYLCTNVNDSHIGAFTLPNRVYNAGTGMEGHNIVGKLMTVDHESGAGSDILMTAAINASDGNKDFTVSPEGGNIEVANPVRLTRTVAKVLLTCVTRQDNANYVNVVDQSDLPGNSTDNTGWIKLADVHYLLNVINRKTYLDYREAGTEPDTYLTDPNYPLSDLIEKRESDEGQVTYGLKDLAAYREEFLYYDTQSMVQLLTQTEGGACTVRQAMQFDEQRIGETSTDHYTEGLYCTENMVEKDMDFSGADEGTFLAVNRFATTHAIVGARYTPKKIWTVNNSSGELTQITANTEEEAAKLLQETTDTDTPGDPVTYAAGTFWQDNDSKEYYTLAAMKQRLQKDPDTDFNRYDGGWGYYYTYIDGDANGDGVIDYAKENRWGVKRNHYYILKAAKIVAPGSAFPGNELMHIHSELVKWIDKGGSEVEISVPQETQTGE